MPKEKEKHIHINIHEYGSFAYLLFIDTCNNKTHSRYASKFKKEETFIMDIFVLTPAEIINIILIERGFYLNDVLVKVFEDSTRNRFLWGGKAYSVKYAKETEGEEGK